MKATLKALSCAVLAVLAVLASLANPAAAADQSFPGEGNGRANGVAASPAGA